MGGYSTTYAITAQLFVFATQETPALAAFAGGGLDGFGGLGCFSKGKAGFMVEHLYRVSDLTVFFGVNAMLAGRGCASMSLSSSC